MKIFDSIQIRKPKRNAFDLSHERKFSMNMGDLVPVLVQDVIPGDKFKVKSENLTRFSPMLAPIMHRVHSYIHYFFVPNRLLWDEWEDFITGGEDGLQEPAFPRMFLDENKRQYLKKGGLADYIGVPTEPLNPDGTPIPITHGALISTLPFRAYQMIYNEYYRDQNLEAEIPINTGSHDDLDLPALMMMRKRAWEKDYFTSCLPWAQRGGEVNLPVDTEGSLTPTYKTQSDVVADDASTYGLVIGDDVTNRSDLEITTGGVNENGPARIENLEDTQDLDIQSTSVTINELRKAVRLQEWLEKNARAGSRYIEQILSHFGVKSSDARLQRPEYLGGGKQPIRISEVLATAGEQDPSNLVPQGNMAGHGISVGNTNTFSRSFEEHGIIIGLMSVIPKTSYEQGISRHLMKWDKFDYYWPEFAHLGEQEVNVQELYHDWTNLDEEERSETFGYQSRYAEYKYAISSVHGDFRDNLNFWHMGRKFNALPKLNADFVKSDPTTRIFALDDSELPEEQQTDKLYVQLYNNVKALRPIPYFNNPRL